MNYNTELQSNNTDLQSILDTINALPESGSGGTSVETCTVRTAIHSSGYYVGTDGTYYATVYRDGTIQNISGTWNSSVNASNPITDVVCGSVFAISGSNLLRMDPSEYIVNASVLYHNLSTYSHTDLFAMPTNSGADVQLFISNDAV